MEHIPLRVWTTLAKPRQASDLEPIANGQRHPSVEYGWQVSPNHWHEGKGIQPEQKQVDEMITILMNGRVRQSSRQGSSHPYAARLITWERNDAYEAAQ